MNRLPSPGNLLGILLLLVTTPALAAEADIVVARPEAAIEDEHPDTIVARPEAILADDRPAVFPNPSDGPVTVRAGSGPVSIEVYDLLGRRVAEVRSSVGAATWDGRDLAGRRVTTGLYFARVHTSGTAVEMVKILRR